MRRGLSEFVMTEDDGPGSRKLGRLPSSQQLARLRNRGRSGCRQHYATAGIRENRNRRLMEAEAIETLEHGVTLRWNDRKCQGSILTDVRQPDAVGRWIEEDADHLGLSGLIQ